ncbi:hypothetical protein C8R44DRAFT_18505 [Mycena epipterygia]|nr:hypothetical protein C8R44DRAFT_18505 [Mycena epipterygia]
MHATQCSECGSFTASSSAEGPRDLDISVVPPGTPTRHHELLASNLPPEGTELTFIRAVVSKTGARIAYLDDEIPRLRDRLIQLKEERKALSIYHSQNNAILSPLRRMPPEVLCDIFSWTLPSVNDGLWHCKFNTKCSPWVLTQICSRWRATAFSTPSLWSLVVLDYTHDHNLPSDLSAYSLPMVDTQIQRAQKIRVHFYGCTNRIARPQVEMFQCLAKHSSRWEELAIQLTPDLFPLLATLSDRLQSLRRLWIQWDQAESQAGVGTIGAFRVAPRLVDVGTSGEHGPIPMLLPAHQLTRYQSSGPWEMHLSILKVAQNLVEAHIEILGSSLEHHDTDIVDLLSLQRLYVSHTEILAYLKTPALKEIGFYLQDDDSNPLDSS